MRLRFCFSKGVTLLELMVSLVVLSVMIILSASTFSDLVQETQAKSAVRNLNQGFSMARSEAVKRRVTVTICALDKGKRCSSDWSQDIAIFEDANEDRALSGGDDLILTINAVVAGNFVVLVSNRNYFQYGATGSARNTMGSVIFCPTAPPSDGKYLKLVIHLSGRTRIDQVSGDDSCSS